MTFKGKVCNNILKKGNIMPEVNDIKSNGIRNRKWVICPDCGKGRWVILSLTKRLTFTGRCHACNASLRGGNRIKSGYRWVNNNGYVLVKLQPDNFFYSMVGQDGYVLEHRLVVAQVLGRCLHSWEIVHHKGTKYPKGSREDKADNRYPENLQLVTDDRHKQISILEAKIQRLKVANKELKRRLKDAK